MAEPSYLYCGGQGDTPFQSACGCPLREETGLQVETHKPGGTATDHGAAHAGEVTGAYP